MKKHSDGGTAVLDAGPEAAARRRIVAGAQKHFFAHGFRGVTMDDLAAGLGMSKKTLYAHFPAKADLLAAAVGGKLDSVDRDLGRILDGDSGDFPALLSRLLACMRQHLDELQSPFLRDIARDTPELFVKVQARRRTMLQRHFGRLLSEGRKAGMIRKDIPPELMTGILIGAADALINPQKLTELDLSMKAALDTIVTIFLHGVMTGKQKQGGRK